MTLKKEKANNKEKMANLRSQIVTSRWGKNIKYSPYVFTEQGVAMLSSVLKSEQAIEIHPVKYASHPVGFHGVNIIIMRAFVKIRNLIYSYKDLAEKMEKLERAHNKHSRQIGKIFEILDKLINKESAAKTEIGFKA